VVSSPQLPDPGPATTLDELVERLRLLKVWAGDPSYEWIKDRVNAAWTAAGRPRGELVGKTTVVDCFRAGRRRLNPELVVAVVRALHPDGGYVAQWRQALQVIGGQREAAAQVRVQDGLPPDLAGFTGRTADLRVLRQALDHCRTNDAGTICAIAGMAGIGKTRLAIRAGHLLARDEPFDRVLFVNLRGFHPHPDQPPADPAAVLDGFLRLLGVAGQQIPHDLPARTAAYRARLAGTRTLVVLDNAADAGQVRPLLPGVPGCPVLVTSRRHLVDLPSATHVALDVFSPEEALALLERTASEVPVGADPQAAARLVRRCGYLPLALGLLSGQLRARPGWTLTDHAERLDERHRDRRLDTAVELAFDVSYQHLPDGQRRLLRLAALHPGQDFDAHAAAALTGVDLPIAGAQLDELCRDHLLQREAHDRYGLHDLVRSYAAGRASDEDPPPARRAALTRLFDYYLATSAAAMNALHPAEAHRRPHAPPPDTPSPTVSDPDAALAWLDIERPTLVAVAGYTAGHGWPGHTTRLSATLFRYLDGGYHTDALIVHGHARDAAQRDRDPAALANALVNLGTTYGPLGRFGPATEHLQQALHLFREVGDPAGQARVLGNLGIIGVRLGHYQQAADLFEHALEVYRQAGDPDGEARSLANLGDVEEQLSRFQRAADHYERALHLFRHIGDRGGEAFALNRLGVVDTVLGRYERAADRFEQALRLHRQLGNRDGEASTRESLGTLDNRRGRPTEAAKHHREALTIFRENGRRDGEAWALNGLAEAAHDAGDLADALANHTEALAIATDIGDRDQQARAHNGLGHAHRSLDDPARARRHYQVALAIYTDLGMAQADQVRTHLDTVDGNGSPTAR
jgi:tetratricopeptide (TPR) repeat protein